jgi:hypothetical protein
MIDVIVQYLKIYKSGLSLEKAVKFILISTAGKRALRLLKIVMSQDCAGKHKDMNVWFASVKAPIRIQISSAPIYASNE